MTHTSFLERSGEDTENHGNYLRMLKATREDTKKNMKSRKFDTFAFES